MPLIATVLVYGVRKASLTSTMRGSNNAIQVYTLSKIGSVPPVSSSDLAAVPVLPLTLFYSRSDTVAIDGSAVVYGSNTKVSTDHGYHEPALNDAKGSRARECTCIKLAQIYRAAKRIQADV